MHWNFALGLLCRKRAEAVQGISSEGLNGKPFVVQHVETCDMERGYSVL
jgi:hypothetical protein